MLYLKFQTIAVFVRQILLSQDDIRCRRPNTRVFCLSDRDVSSEVTTIFHAVEFVSGRSETGFRIE